MNFLRKAGKLHQQIRKMGELAENRDPYWLERIGTREIVGYGFNGTPGYADKSDFPFPAIRFQETSAEIQSLMEKAKGDWRLLSKNEKKSLYRASFCQTFVEFQNQKGDWLEVFGTTLILCSVALWLILYIKIFVYEELPESFRPNRQRAQLRRQIDLHMNPIQGLAANWDYEKMDWKKITWRTPNNPFVQCEDDE